MLRISWNLNVDCNAFVSQLSNSVFNQFSSFRISTAYLSKINSITILYLRPDPTGGIYTYQTPVRTPGYEILVTQFFECLTKNVKRSLRVDSFLRNLRGRESSETSYNDSSLPYNSLCRQSIHFFLPDVISIKGEQRLAPASKSCDKSTIQMFGCLWNNMIFISPFYSQSSLHRSLGRLRRII